jgi:hypothetical protein
MKRFGLLFFLLITTLSFGQTQAGQAYAYSASTGATATAVKTTSGALYSWCVYNSNSSAAYVQFFNLTTANVTLGTTAPYFAIGVGATSAVCGGSEVGIKFSTAISYAATTTRGGLTAPSNTVDVNFFYN